jgi:manganese/zinc/iron transport system permease protein
MSSTLIGAILLGALGGMLGNFLILRRMALFGDMISHSLLPGLCFGFFLASYKKDYFFLLLGAFLSALLANYINEKLQKRRIFKADASLAILISGFYALGALLITKISKLHGSELSGLKGYILGQAALIQKEDLIPIFVLLCISALYLFFFYRQSILASFDKNYLAFRQKKPQLYLLLSSTLIILTLMLSLQMVGAILAASFLLIPASASLFLTANLKLRFVYSTLIGVFIGALGTLFSSMDESLATGPTIILLGFFVFLGLALFGPHKSLWSRKKFSLELQNKKLRENLLRAAYYFQEDQKNTLSLLQLMSRSSENKDVKNARKALRILITEGVFKELKANQYSLTQKGMHEAKEITRKHRLWESYVVEKMGLESNLAHENAEVFEHFLSAENLEQIEAEIPQTKDDPHGKKIPATRKTPKK